MPHPDPPAASSMLPDLWHRWTEGAIGLDPRAQQADLTFNGTNTRLKVKGTVVVNNGGSGLDQFGAAISTDLGTTSQPAVVTSNTAVYDPTQAYVQARAVQVRAGGWTRPRTSRTTTTR